MGRSVAATFAINYVFSVTATLLTLNLVWVYLKVPEIKD